MYVISGVFAPIYPHGGGLGGLGLPYGQCGHGQASGGCRWVQAGARIRNEIALWPQAIVLRMNAPSKSCALRCAFRVFNAFSSSAKVSFAGSDRHARYARARLSNR